MKCPICSKNLINRQKDLLMCPDGHGALVTGKHLGSIKDSTDIIENINNIHTEREHQIICPHCSANMHHVNYNSTGIIIDSCIKCHYRWLDAGEITKIRSHNPDISYEDQLLINELDNKIHEASNRVIEESNPKINIGSPYLTSADIINPRGNNRVKLTVSTLRIFYLIYKGLTYSKTSRILTIVTILLLGSIMLLIFIEMKKLF